jgi:molybdate transport system substrate-binding protein
VDTDSRRSLLSNRLVVIAPSDSRLALASAEDLAKATLARIAMADPEAVPAGKYAKAWLTKTGQWSEALRAKVLATADVRAALAAVASGNVDAGIVYNTDAAISPRVRIVYVVPEADAPKISYPIAVMAHSEDAEAARKVADYLSGPEPRSWFEKCGFITMGSAASK